MVDSFPQITPYLLYEDVPAALEFLSEAFGFREQLRYEAEDGTVNHAEMRLDAGGVIFLGDPGPDFESPRRRGTPGAQVHVYLDDVDGHFQRAKTAGAEIRREPVDQPYGDRRYDAWDPEGNLWSFAQHLLDVRPEEWGAIPG